MKNLIINLLTILILPSLIHEPVKTSSVQTEEIFAYNEMVGLSSSINGNEVTPLNSGNINVSYGFYHGSVANDSINKFTNVLADNIGSFSEITSFFSNWRMGVVPGDNLIIKFSSNVKTNFSTFRNKLGADFREDLVLNIYNDNTLMYTHTFTGGSDKASDFSFSTTLDENKILYYELVSTGDAQRHISMESSGSDFTSLPTFKFSEYIEENAKETTFSEMFTGFKNKLSKVTSKDSLFKYGFYSGSITNKSLAYLPLNNDKLSANGVSITDSKVNLEASASFTLRIDAIEDTSLSISYPNAAITSENGMIFRGFKFLNSKSKTKQQYSRSVTSSFDKSFFEGRFALKEGETLYLEFKASEQSGSTEILPLIRSAKLILNYNDSSLFPKYEPSNFKDKSEIDHKTLAFESARINCEPVEMEKISISMLEGVVSLSENIVELDKYLAVKYDDGVYLEGTESPKMMLSDIYDVFDGKGFAGVEDYRLKTSVAKANVFAIDAKTNVTVNITHPKMEGGWIDDAGETYFATYLHTKNKLFETFYKDLTNANSPENAYANKIYLKEGDRAYFVFGTRVAEQRNVNVRFNFDTFEDFDEEAYKNIFGDIVTSVDLINAVTDIKNNNCDPVIYDENLEVSLMHGNQKEYEKMNPGVTNDGYATDVLFAGNGENDNLAMFYKWQIRAGKSNDNAVTIFKALNNLELNLTHDDISDVWATSSSVKYYVRSSEGFLMYLDERFVQPDTEENHYGYNIHLKTGEALILVYSSNDEQSTGTFDMLWTVTANPKNFDETKTSDFAEAKELETFKQEKLDILLNYYNSVKRSDYSVTNYLYFTEYIDSYEKEVETLTDKDAITAVFNKYYNKMKAIKTIAQEQEYIANIRSEAISEASSYLDSHLKKMTKDGKNTAQTLFEELKNKINASSSETEIKLLVKQFKNNIDELSTNEGCGGSIACASTIIALISLTTLGLLRFKKESDE